MSSFVDGYNRTAPGDYRLRVLNEEFQHDFPTLGQCFTGVLSDDRQKLLLPPCKLTIWAEAGRLECCLLPTIGRRKAFLSLGDGLASPWTALEELLSAGVRWVDGSGQKRS